MANENSLIMNLLRIMTPDEVAEIATKHNGGRFVLLTDIVHEKIEKNVDRDFSLAGTMNELFEETKAEIIPFKKNNSETNSTKLEAENKSAVGEEVKSLKHLPNENMSSFILIEKERLRRSQTELKKKEIVALYKKNSNVVVDEIKVSNENNNQSSEGGILVNKRHY